MKTGSSYWIGAMGLTVAIYALLAACPDFLAAWGIRLPLGHWFVDTYALLAASDANAQGLDPYQDNPLDLLHVPHWYSSWWFRLHDLGLTRKEVPWIGVGVVAVFLLASFRVLRPKNFGAFLYVVALLCGPPVLLGASRANMDLAIFAAFVLCAWLLAHERKGLRLLGPPVIALVTGLKFYPLAAAAALPVIPQSRRDGWMLNGFMLVLALALAFGLYHDVMRVAGVISMPMRLYTFGAPQIFALAGMGNGWAMAMASGVVLFLAALTWWRGPELPEDLGNREERALFALGATVLVACFCIGLNYGYRLVFGLLLVPFAGRLLAAPGPDWRRPAAVTLGGLLALLWLDGVICCVMLGFGWEKNSLERVLFWRDLACSMVSWIWVAVLTGLLVSAGKPQVRRLFGLSKA